MSGAAVLPQLRGSGGRDEAGRVACGKWTRTDEGQRGRWTCSTGISTGSLRTRPGELRAGLASQLPAEVRRDITIIVAIDECGELAVARLERLRPLGAKNSIASGMRMTTRG